MRPLGRWNGVWEMGLVVEAFRVGPMDNGSYLVYCDGTKEAAVVDPSYDSLVILDRVRELGLNVRWILNTHAHFDHVVENAAFVRETGATLAIHSGELPLLQSLDVQASMFGVEAPEYVEPGHLLSSGEQVPVGKGSLEVRMTSGHSPASVSFVGPGFVICGDALFSGSIGRTDFPGCSHDTLLASIRSELLSLPDETVVYPGHGPATTIGHERTRNPFLQ